MQKKPLHLAQLFLKSFDYMKSTWLNVVLIAFLIICMIIAFIFVAFIIYYLIYFFKLISNDTFLLYRFSWQLITYLISVALTAIAQILIINILFNPKLAINDNLKSIKKFFWKFFCLTIIINIFFIFFTLPINLAFIFFTFNYVVLAVISFFLGVIFTFIFVCLLVFSPFILIDQNMRCLAALKESFHLAKSWLKNIAFKIIILILIFIILNSLMFIVLPIPFLGLILSAVFFVILLLFSFSYLFVLYQDFKRLKNA